MIRRNVFLFRRPLARIEVTIPLNRSIGNATGSNFGIKFIIIAPSLAKALFNNADGEDDDQGRIGVKTVDTARKRAEPTPQLYVRAAKRSNIKKNVYYHPLEANNSFLSF